MNVLIILRTIFLHIKNIFHLKGFGTECAPYNSIDYVINLIFCYLKHSHKKRKGSLETWAKRAVLHAYVESQAILFVFYLFILYFNSLENHKKRHDKECTSLYIPNKYKLKYI